MYGGLAGSTTSVMEEGVYKQVELPQRNQQAHGAEVEAGGAVMSSESTSNNVGVSLGVAVLREKPRSGSDCSRISPGSAVGRSPSYALERRETSGTDQHYSYDVEPQPYTSPSSRAAVANNCAITPPDTTMQQLQKGQLDEDNQRPPRKRRRTSDPPAITPRALAPTLYASSTEIELMTVIADPFANI